MNMDNEKIQTVLSRYNQGHADEADLKAIEQYLAEGIIDLEDLQPVTVWQNQLDTLSSPEPSGTLNDRFYDMLAQEKRANTRHSFSWSAWFSWSSIMPKLAYGIVMLAAGLAGGYFIQVQRLDTKGNGGTAQIEELSQQVTDLKEMMMLSLLEKESATERLKAVSLTEEMDQASNKVTQALLQTLNNDSNVNVRLAALDALKPYVKDSEVREELIRSIGQQQSPLVQIELAELMAALQVKSSVKELEKLLDDKKTPQEVKKKIQQSIEVII
jgi:D-ribose pyranose/furanose isomerase RbsD